jgi:hypothetical protein
LPQEYGVLDPEYNLLDPQYSHVDPRHAGHHPTISFVGDDADGAGLRDREVAAADPHVGRQELASQLAASRGAENGRISCPGDAELPFEQLTDVLDPLVYDRCGNVARRLVGELDDVLSEIRLDYFDTRSL